MTFQDDNGNQLEFNGEFAMTKRAVSFFNGSIQGDVSINFTVDNNSINRKVLGYFGPQMVNQVAWTKQAFNRIRNGNIIDRGYIVIQNEDGGKLSCFYVSGNSNWVQLLNGLITALDYSGITNGTDYNTLLSRTIQSSQPTTGVIFPMVDWCYNLKKAELYYWMVEESTINDCVVDSRHDQKISLFDFYPCFYLSSLVTEIAKQNGLKFSGNLFSEQLYNSIIIPPVNGQMKRSVFKSVSAAGSNQNIVAGTTVKYTSLTETQDPDNIFSVSSFVSNRKGSIVVTVTITTGSTGGLYLYKNGAAAFAAKNWSYNGEVYSFPIIYLNYGDVIDLYWNNTTGGNYNVLLNARYDDVEVIKPGDYVNPSHFLPSLTCLDIIKFIINYFGCVATYNESSKTINCNIVEKISTESAYDWSEYFESVRSEYTVNQAQNNYLRLDQDDADSAVKKYNSNHDLKFGEGNITTGNTLKKEKDAYKYPFAPTSFGLAKNGFYQADIPLINLIDDGDPVSYTVIADIGGGISKFTVPDGTIYQQREIIRLSNSNGYSYGYWVILFTGVDYIELQFPFTATDTGKIWKQSINYQEVKPRILTIKPNTNLSDFSTNSSITIVDSNNSTSVSTAPIAIFTKPIITDTLDQWKNNLAIDNPDSGGFIDPTIKQLYFNKISKFLQNPNIRCKMLLPESVYQSFAFDQFIYLKTKNLTGYFFVDSIVNYIDANTPVEVNLYML